MPSFLLILSLIAVLVHLPGCSSPGPIHRSAESLAIRPVATYSIVARDPATGQMGVAVQSHWFSVGPIVPWAEAGVGAVATQSLVDPAYGPLGLDLMGMGKSAPEALRSLLAGDEGREVRQVAMVDAKGRVAVHTGSRCIREAGHVEDAERQFTVQANLMDRPTVPAAMAEAFRSADGDLAQRMISALQAAEAEGGDIRGRQSAAILIVAAEATGKPWVNRIVDLRVEDHPDPVAELDRLLGIHRAYQHMNAGDVAIEHGDAAAAAREYSAAARLAPEIAEIPFWHAVALAANGEVDEALPVFRDVFAREDRWVALIPRLVEAGILPDDSGIVEQILSQQP